MHKYIALLRGVNVSGKNILKMADLKLALEKAGFQHVMTYIQSGNIVFESKETPEELRFKIEQLIADQFSLTVPVLILSHGELKAIAQENPFSIDPNSNQDLLYYVFLFELPDPLKVEALLSIDYSPDLFEIKNKIIYMYPVNGAGNSKLSTNLFESKLKVTATARNHKTVNKLIELSS